MEQVGDILKRMSLVWLLKLRDSIGYAIAIYGSGEITLADLAIEIDRQIEERSQSNQGEKYGLAG